MGLKNTAIEAGAGCGKTTKITTDIIDGLKKGQFDIDRIVVITFTKKAAGELKSLITLELQKQIGEERIEQQIKKLGNARISTIHSFCESLLKERPLEAGVDPGFQIIEETEQEEFLEKVYDEWLRDKLDKHPLFFRKLLIEMNVSLKTPNCSFSARDNSFQGIIKRALEYREMDLFFPERPEDVSAILPRFISECESYLSSVDGGALYDFIRDYIDTLKNALHEDSSDYLDLIKKYKPGSKGGAGLKELRESWKETCADFVGQIEYSVNFPEIESLHKEANILIKDFIEHYRETMKSRGIMDFNEIMFKTNGLLASNQIVREYFKKKYDFIFVDEFQDTDPLQTAILFFLAEKQGRYADGWEKIDLDDSKLYVVGDPKQSIYRFRRADIEIYTAAMQRIAETTYLKTNYRSKPEIIDWVNQFFEGRIKKPDRGSYQAEYVPLEPPESKKPGGEVVIVSPEVIDESQKKDEARKEEARLTASWIRQACDGGTDQNRFNYRDILVLFRKKSNMQLTAEYLEQANIPYELVGARSYFGRAEIRDISNLLNCLANPLDQISLAAVLKGPFYSLTDRDLFEWRLLGNRISYRGIEKEQVHVTGKALLDLSELHRKSRKQDAAGLLTQLFEERGILASYAATFRGRPKVLNLIKALELLKSYGKIPFCTAARLFSEKVEQNAEMADFSPKTEGENTVQLMTIHKAKGLGSKVLYLADSTSSADFTNDIFVDNSNKRLIYRLKTGYETAEFNNWKEEDKAREIAEVERLRYVAATRAKEALIINCVPGNGFDKTFSFPFHQETLPVKEETIDISSLTLDPGKLGSKPKPAANNKLADEIVAIKERTVAAVEKVSEPSITIQSPSLVEGADPDLKVSVIFNPDSADFRIEGVTAATVGTMAHKLLQLEPDDLDAAAATLIQNEQLDIDPAELSTIVKAMQDNDLKQRVNNARTVLREVPLKYRSGDIHYDGTIDLLFEEEDGWVLVDYKAITISNQQQADSVKAKYTGQLQVYAEGLRQMGLTVKDCMIVSG